MQAKSAALVLLLVGAAAAYYFPDGPPRPARQADDPPAPQPRQDDDDNGGGGGGMKPQVMPQQPANRDIIEIRGYRQVQPEPKQVLNDNPPPSDSRPQPQPRQVFEENPPPAHKPEPKQVFEESPPPAHKPEPKQVFEESPPPAHKPEPKQVLEENPPPQTHKPEPRQILEENPPPAKKPEPRLVEGITLVPRRKEVVPEGRQASGCQMNYAFSGAGESATIQSPNYPSEYPNNVRSTVCFSSPSGTSMTVSCDDFNVEQQSSCSWDYLGLGLTGDPNSLQKYCGRGQLQSPASAGNSLVVAFKTDGSNPGASSRSPYRFRCKINVASSGGSGTTTTTTTTTTTAAPIGGGGGSGSGTGNCTCGKRKDASRIVGGVDARVNEFPWRCYMKTSRYSFFCGCSIISNNWIMTAAHCTRAVMPLPEGDKLYVVVGDHDRSTSTDSVSQQVEIPKANVFDHPQYNPKTMDYDMSLLKLASPITYSNTISPVCLPWNYRTDEFTGTTVVAGGWGTTSQGGSTSNTLKQVDLPVVNSTECNTYYPGQITERMICTYLPGKDTCQGDSGGSIDLLRNSRYYAIGVVSWGIGCAQKDNPGVYSKTTKFLDWIQTTTNDQTFCKA